MIMSDDEECSELPRRKLTTILAADVVGYSRMMGIDEDGTHRLLSRCRKNFERHIKHHGGRIFNTAGDSVMAEFGSTVEAVHCAIKVQEEITAGNSGKTESEQMWFRIGLNVGDVIIEGDDLIGDGVNIAARMESIAAPGGICISGSVYELVHNKLSFAFVDMGKQAVKNITEPVSTYSLHPAETPRIKPGMAAKSPPWSGKWKRIGLSVAVAMAIVTMAVIMPVYFVERDVAKDDLAKQQETALSAVSVPEIQLGERADVDRKSPSVEPVMARKIPAYFFGRAIEGVSVKKGERFVIEMTGRGGAIVTIYKKEEPAEVRKTDSGRWWIDKKEMICFKFRGFSQGKKFCRIHIVDEDGEWLVSGNPAKPKWVLQPR